MRRSRRLRLSCWLALSAMWVMALAPAVSHALAFDRGTAPSWTEVCTAQGLRLVAVAAGADGAALDRGGAVVASLDPCPYCLLSSQALGMPPRAPAALAVPERAEPAPPRLFFAALRTPLAWSRALPRAPPPCA